MRRHGELEGAHYVRNCGTPVDHIGAFLVNECNQNLDYSPDAPEILALRI